LVPADPADAGKAQRHARFVPRAGLGGIERHLEHQLLPDLAHGAESGNRIGPYPFVELLEFGIGKAEIGLSDRHDLIALPHPERIVRIARAALAVPTLAYISTASTMLGSRFHLNQ